MIFRNFRTGFLILLFSGLFVITSETNENQVETKRSGYWTFYCKNFDDNMQCEIARKIKIEQQIETFLIVYKITKDTNSKIKESLNIITPPASRVDTKKRLKISFDGKTKFTRSFLKCEETDCLAIFKGSRMLKYSLKNFTKMKITFYAPENKDPTSLTLPIDGFTKALEDINRKLKSQ